MPQNKIKAKNILMIVDGYYPADIRVRKEAESLAVNFNVFILCCRSKNENETEVIKEVTVLRKVFYKSFLEKGITDICLAINFIHPKFNKILSRVIEINKIDVIHVHDLPLAKTGYLAAKKHDLTSIIDLHENYAAALITWFSWRRNPLIKLKNKLFFNYKRWQKYENNIIQKYDKIIAVVEEMKERIVKENLINSNKVIVITNSEKKEFADNFNSKNNTFFTKYNNKFIISYVGGFGPHRGLQTAIEGMKEISKQIPEALLALIGPANADVKSYLENLIDQFDVRKNVFIYGSQPFKEVINIMQSSDINIIPHVSNLHTESTIPHKLYQILLSKKALLVSDCAPLKRVVSTHAIGTVFNAGNATSFSEKVIDIYTNYEKANEKAKNGFDLVYNGNLNWEFSSKELIDLYNNL